MGRQVVILVCVTLGSLSGYAQTAGQWLARGDSLLRSLDLTDAREVFRKAVREGEEINGRLGIARVYRQAGRWADLRDELEWVLAHDSLSVEAHYLRAIAYRELAGIGTPAQARFRRRSREHFETALRLDSLYKDVLLQYGYFFHLAGDPDQAFALGNLQVSKKPSLTNGKSGFVRLVRQIVVEMNDSAALAWLQRQPGDYTSYVLGEFLRTHNDSEEARLLFGALIARPSDLPSQFARLALARIYYADNRPMPAQRQVDLAVEEISSASDAAILFEDFKYILNDEELVRYRMLEKPDEFRQFFASLWRTREPIPTSKLRVRLAEHYRRLLAAEKEYAYYGLRSWHLLPDNRMPFTFPASYALNQEYNDKGLIYIRYGPPSEKIVSVGGMDEIFSASTDSGSMNDWLPIELRFDVERGVTESWRYENPRLDFHFMRAALENAWFLSPVVSGQRALEDREHWGGTYVQMARILREHQRHLDELSSSTAMAASERGMLNDSSGVAGTFDTMTSVESPGASGVRLPVLEIQDIHMRMVDAAQADVATVMSTDRHTWTDELEQFEMPFVLAAYRDNDGQSRLEMHYALPLGQVSKTGGEWAHHVEVEVGLGVHDSLWNPVEQFVETKRMPTSRDQTAALLDFVSLIAPPDSYQVSVHARPINGNMLAGYKVSRRVPRFAVGQTNMSDLLLAYEIGPAMDQSRFNRSGLSMRVNPFARFRTEEPLYVYFELYDLTFDRDDRTRYTVEYRLQPKERRRSVRRLFGRRDQPTLTLRFEREGSELSPAEWGELDVTSVDPGAYVLDVTVSDQLTGTSMSRSIELLLTD